MLHLDAAKTWLLTKWVCLWVEEVLHGIVRLAPLLLKGLHTAADEGLACGSFVLVPEPHASFCLKKLWRACSAAHILTCKQVWAAFTGKAATCGRYRPTIGQPAHAAAPLQGLAKAKERWPGTLASQNAACTYAGAHQLR